MKISSFPKRITEPSLKTMSKKFDLDVSVIKTVLSIYGEESGFNKDGSLVCSNVRQANTKLLCSWGIGGVMGTDFKKAGYVDENTMVLMFQDSEVEQVNGLLTLIKSTKRLYKALKETDWVKVSYYYTGIGHRHVITAQALYANYKNQVNG